MLLFLKIITHNIQYMLDIPEEITQYVILPLMAAQLFLVVSLYFTFVGRHVLNQVGFFNCFVATYVLYMVGQAAQMYSDTALSYSILFFRVTLFLTICLPSLCMFLFSQCGVKLSRAWLVFPYVFGFLLSLVYVICADARHEQLMFDASYVQLLPFTMIRANHIDAEMTGLVVLSLLPTSFLLYRELTGERRSICLAFLIGAVMITSLYITGLYHQVYWLYYFGAIFTALYWSRAVYRDVKSTKSQAQYLKEQLQLSLKRDETTSNITLNNLLQQIERDSSVDLKRYKLKVREILDVLTDTTIEAGGDADALIDRNLNKVKSIIDSDDVNAIRDIAKKETIELTNMISDLPAKRSERIIFQTKLFIENNYHEDIEVASLAEAAGVSQSYLMRCFKEYTGQTIKQYLNQYRIEKAKERLADLTVSDTAFSVGFNDSNYFGAVFKKLTGIGPQQYKKETYG